MVPEGHDLPFFAIVGHSGSPAWSDTAVAFACSCHLVAKGEAVVSAANAMGVAAGTEKIFVEIAPNLQKGYLGAGVAAGPQPALDPERRAAQRGPRPVRERRGQSWKPRGTRRPTGVRLTCRTAQDLQCPESDDPVPIFVPHARRLSPP